MLFNRAPKTGSETLVELMTRLGKVHNFQVVRYKSNKMTNRLIQPKKDQKFLAEMIIGLGEMSVYFQNLNYINFTEFNLPRPIFINMVRDPVERVISWFYYKRSPYILVKTRMTAKNYPFPDTKYLEKDYNTCVLKRDIECSYIQNNDITQRGGGEYARQTIYYCGHDKVKCTLFNSRIPMQIAKHRVEKEYAVVGTWEDLNITLAVFDAYIPKFFRGAKNMYYLGGKTAYSNANQFRPKILEEVKNMVRKNFTNEIEFYHFCRQRLHKQYLALQLDKLNIKKDDYEDDYEK